MTMNDRKSAVPLSTDMSRFGWGDLAEIAGSVVLGYFLDDPSIPIDVALSKLGNQLSDLQNRLDKITAAISEIENFLNTLVPTLSGVFNDTLIRQAMGEALGAYQEIQDVISQPSTFGTAAVQQHLTSLLQDMHEKITGVLGITKGGMAGLFATHSAFACYVKGYMAQQRILEPHQRKLIWDTTFHRFYIDGMYGLVNIAQNQADSYHQQMKSMPLHKVYRFDVGGQKWIDSNVPYQDSYHGDDFHNLFYVAENPVLPQRVGLLSTYLHGMIQGWQWTGANYTTTPPPGLFKDPATVVAANCYWLQQKPLYLECRNFFDAMGDLTKVKAAIVQGCDTKDPKWYPKRRNRIPLKKK